MISHPSRHCTVELQALPSRIGQVRRIVSAQLRYWHMDPLIDRAALGVTELLSNVHRHARPDKSCTVELELLSDRLTVSVRDHDPRLPVVADEAEAAHATPLATCGRGLAMVAAVSESWGARPDGDDGKVVWFTLPASAAAHGQRAPLRTTEQQPVPRITEMQPAPAPVAASAPAPTVTHTSAMTPVRTSPPVSAPAPAPALAPVAASASAPAPARSAVPG
ncbi:ATP-binding protein [Streptomyces sp. NPDC002520]